jgi:WD40 repeat protein
MPFEDAELDALFFFGREREREIIAANLLASRLTVLYGATGVGKSSLLRAGVARHLRTLARTRVAVISTWSSDPTDEIDAEVEAAGEDDLYLILDQIEEYFLYHGRDDRFARRLPELVSAPGLRVNVLLGVREDSLAKLDFFKRRIPTLFSNYLRLDHLDRIAARAAIRGPLQRLNEIWPDAGPFEVETELVEAVLDQVEIGRIDYGLTGRGVAQGRDEPARIEAPFLQLVLERLWQVERDQDSRTLRLATLGQLGGAERIVQDHLEHALESLTPEQQVLAANVFEHLVTPTGSKIAHGVQDLARYARASHDEVQAMLGQLAAERIIRPVDDGGGNGRYEIFHDVLAEGVLAWRAAFESQRELAIERRRRRRAIGVASTALVALAAVTAIALFALAQRENARDAARRAHARELAARANVFLQTDAAHSLALAAQAARLDASPAVERQLRDSLAASRVLAVYRAKGGPATDAAVTTDGRRLAIGSGAGWIRVIDLVRGRPQLEVKQPGGVTALVFSRDGSTLVSGGSDGAARLWDPTRGRLLRAVRHQGPVTSVSLSRDGLQLVTGSADGTAKVWTVATGDLISGASMPGPVSIARFSPAGDRVAAVSGGTLRLFDPATGRVVRGFTERGTIAGIDFSANGRLLATANFDKTARIWRLYPVALEHRLRGHLGRVVDVSFSPRGTLVATASTDGTGRVWNAGRGTPVATLLGHRNYVNSARFSSDGFFVITASRDKTARVWNAESGKLLSLLSGHRGTVTRASFLPGGGRAITRSEDGTVRVWDAGTQPELRMLARHGAPVTSVSFGATAATVLSGGADGEAKLWRGRRLVRVYRHGPPVTDVAIHEDRRLVVTAGVDGVARVWPLAGGEPRKFRHGARVNAVAVNADGSRLATAGQDGTSWIWNLRTGNRIYRLRQRGPVLDVAFDPSGSRLATAGADGVARIWDGVRVEHELRGHTDDVLSVAFSPGGRLLVTAGRDHDGRLWNTQTGALVRKLEGHFSAVNEAAFSSDARWVVTAGGSTAALWETRSDRSFFLHGDGHIGQVFSAAFSPHGYRVATGAEDGTVRTYSCVICGRVPALLERADRRLAEARVR